MVSLLAPALVVAVMVMIVMVVVVVVMMMVTVWVGQRMRVILQESGPLVAKNPFG